MDIKKFIKQIADAHLEHFIKQGHADAGCNGPYGGEDTPIRNTAHWAVTYKYLHDQYGDSKYADILEVFGKYLLRSDNYGANGASKCRYLKKGIIDDVNGVIGQAWLIEGLLALYDYSKDVSYLDKSYNAYKSQIFEPSVSLWHICNTDGKIMNCDWTFNHHLWLAAAASDLLKRKYYKDIDCDINAFISNLRNTFYVHHNGILFHQANIRPGFINKMKFWKMYLLRDFGLSNNSRDTFKLQFGYQLFDLYGFAILKNNIKDRKLLTLLDKSVEMSISKSLKWNFLEKLHKPNLNKYAFPYNSPAFEYPFISKVYCLYDEKISQELLNIQLSCTYNATSSMFDKNNNDPNTLTARIYELIRFLNYD